MEYKTGIADLMGKVVQEYELEGRLLGMDEPMKCRCHRCHAQESLTFFVEPLKECVTYSFSICARCGCADWEYVVEGHPDYETMREMKKQHPKHVQVDITEKDVRIKVVKNLFYRAGNKDAKS